MPGKVGGRGHAGALVVFVSLVILVSKSGACGALRAGAAQHPIAC
jgi:hypothetical protein